MALLALAAQTLGDVPRPTAALADCRAEAEPIGMTELVRRARDLPIG